MRKICKKSLIICKFHDYFLILQPMKRVRSKKNLGQHFLIDLNNAKAIADTVDACPDCPSWRWKQKWHKSNYHSHQIPKIL